jgi:hypothetical protein
MHPGDARNTGRSAESGAGAGVATDGTAFAPASLFIQPNPATGASVRVRVQVRRSVAVEVRVVNVEGQIVTRLGPISVAGGSLLEENISIANLAGGFYLCQVEAAGERQTRVFTIAR